MKRRNENEILDQLNLAAESEIEGRSKWPAMTYEEGVSAALRWVIGETDDRPMDNC